MGNPVGFTTHKRVGEPDYTQSINLFFFLQKGGWGGGRGRLPLSRTSCAKIVPVKRDFDIANRENLTIYKAAVLNLY